MDNRAAATSLLIRTGNVIICQLLPGDIGMPGFCVRMCCIECMKHMHEQIILSLTEHCQYGYPDPVTAPGQPMSEDNNTESCLSSRNAAVEKDDILPAGK